MVGIEMLAGTIRADMLGRLPRRNKMRRDGLSLVVAMMLDVRGANLVEMAATAARPPDRLDTPPIALTEDYNFVRRRERASATVRINDPPPVTSSRRFAGRSPAAIEFGWLEIHALFHFGVSPDRLAPINHGGRARRV